MQTVRAIIIKITKTMTIIITIATSTIKSNNKNYTNFNSRGLKLKGVFLKNERRYRLNAIKKSYF